MDPEGSVDATEEPPANASNDDGDLTDMLGELRVLLPTAQLLSAFLIAVPFAPGFQTIVQSEKHVFLATFLLSVSSLILFTAPAVQHRLMRPLRHRPRFKTRASQQILVGATLLAVALVLATQFVLSAVLGHRVGNIAATAVGILIAAMWALLPLSWRRGAGSKPHVRAAPRTRRTGQLRTTLKCPQQASTSIVGLTLKLLHGLQ